ncbi:ABC transporter permease [Paracoccus luteus]|uniref:ABC transporter permease n=1 Tax=Paracoccus luteus TaxID=2508543 RepID=UPI00106F8BF5|nr:ABC transporter permease [Paracoccus luteus]
MIRRLILSLSPGLIAIFVFVALPMLWVVRTSFNDLAQGSLIVETFALDNYTRFLGDPWYLVNTLWFTVRIAVLATAVSVICAYPVALYIARATGVQRNILMALIMAPLLIGLVTLVYGWIVIFRGGGLLNSLMIALNVYDEPVRYMWDIKGVVILLVYIGMPYVVLSLLDSIERISPYLVEAARNVGASPWTAFWKIVFPLTMPGLYAGLVIVFSLNFAAFAVPLMIGDSNTQMIGLVIYREALLNNDLPFASALSVIMVSMNALILVGMAVLFGHLILNRLEAKR